MARKASSGKLCVVGVGPGDAELMTLKAARIIASAPVVAFFAKRGKSGHARSIAAGQIRTDAVELRLEYPFTTEVPVREVRYSSELAAFYKFAAAAVAQYLDNGSDVALLCEGDPFFYGSSLAVLDRLGDTYRREIIPGVTGMSGCWTCAGLPMVHHDDVLTVLPGTLEEDRLVEHLSLCDAAVIMKVGSNLAKIRAALQRTGLMSRAVCVERGTMDGERIFPLEQLDRQTAPYFSLVLIPGRQRVR
jgi:precorrin-2/cobalt-factor-2 C20-methyltransferase